MTADAIARVLADALDGVMANGCPACNGDCASANPPVYSCPVQIISEAKRELPRLLAADRLAQRERHAAIVRRQARTLGFGPDHAPFIDAIARAILEDTP